MDEQISYLLKQLGEHDELPTSKQDFQWRQKGAKVTVDASPDKKQRKIHRKDNPDSAHSDRDPSKARQNIHPRFQPPVPISHMASTAPSGIPHAVPPGPPRPPPVPVKKYGTGGPRWAFENHIEQGSKLEAIWLASQELLSRSMKPSKQDSHL